MAAAFFFLVMGACTFLVFAALAVLADYIDSKIDGGL
jgi:hypothetical protein